MTTRSWRSAMARMASQSGALPMRFGARIALVRGADHRLDGVDVDLEGVGRDVDEHRHEPLAHHRRDVGGEGQRRGDDLVAGVEVEQFDGQVERRAARVAHHAAALAEELGDPPFHRLDVAPDPQGGRPTAQHLDDGLDLALVVDRSGVLDAAF